MKSIVIYYSLEGHTKRIAGQIAKESGAQLYEIMPVKNIPQEGSKKFAVGGFSALFHLRPRLQSACPDLTGYDRVYFGTPVWAGTFAPPLRTLLAQTRLQNKQVALFACNKGGGAIKCFEKLRKLLKGNFVLGQIEFVEPNAFEEDGEIERRVKNWINHVNMQEPLISSAN